MAQNIIKIKKYFKNRQVDNHELKTVLNPAFVLSMC
jgi:hypothetical protein